MVLTEEERRDRRKEHNRKYRENNKEKILENKRKYNQTDAGKKSRRISEWKRMGVECDDWDVLYEYFINCKNCEECNIELTVDKRTTPTTRCLDHDHETNQFRNVVCNRCNLKRK